MSTSQSGAKSRNTSSATNSCTPLSLNIHQIQGNGATTTHSGVFVSTSGIVTARKNNGFFLQNAVVNYDLDDATSEGIFVFTSSSPAVAVGDAVGVLGTATEFFNLTQIESTLPGDVTVTTSGNPLPASVVLTTTILSSTGTPDQLENLEAMRVHANSLVSVAPTKSLARRSQCSKACTAATRAGIEFGYRFHPTRPQMLRIAAFRSGIGIPSES